MKERIAAIDIGTNSVLLTVVEYETERGLLRSARNDMRPVYEAATITRIGEGLTESNKFKTEAMGRTLSTIKEYKKKCSENSVDEIFVVGTAAMRKAENSDEFIKMVKDECGLEVEVISGEREAELSFKAVEKDFGSDVLVIDIGGGSTEFIFKNDTDLELSSLHLGSVTMQEMFGKSDPINDIDFSDMQDYVAAALRGGLSSWRRQSPATTFKQPNAKSKQPNAKSNQSGTTFNLPDMNRPNILVATAGTATTLAAMKLKLEEYSHSEVHGLILSTDDIKEIIDDLKVRTIEERKKLPGLEPKRADVILPGALILLNVMKKYRFAKATVSDRGVRWGLLYEML